MGMWIGWNSIAVVRQLGLAVRLVCTLHIGVEDYMHGMRQITFTRSCKVEISRQGTCCAAPRSEQCEMNEPTALQSMRARRINVVEHATIGSGRETTQCYEYDDN